MRDYDLIIVRVAGLKDVTLKPLSRKGFRFFEETSPYRVHPDHGIVCERKVQKVLQLAFAADLCFKVWQS